jgi:RHS repeat-associated protein
LVTDQRTEAGALYRRNRYYDPEVGQFTQEDPIGLAGGLNLYGYADGDPVNFSDPFGLCPMCVVGLVVLEEAARGAVVGGVSGALMQVAANKLSGAPIWEGVGEATAVGAGVGAVTAGVGSAIRIGRAVTQARSATGFARGAAASKAEANAAGEVFTGRPSRPIYDARASGRPQVGMRNNATGNQYRSVHTDHGTPTPHANLQNAQGGNLHLEVNSSVRWLPWKW